MVQCAACGYTFSPGYPEPTGGAGEIIDVTAETPEGEIVGRPSPVEPPRGGWSERRGPKGFTIQYNRRMVAGPGCCGPGCLIFVLLFLWLLLRGC